MVDTHRLRTVAERIGEANHAYAQRSEHALDDAADEIDRLRGALKEIHEIANLATRDADMDEALNEIVLLAGRALGLAHD